MFVISRNTAFAYRNKSIDTKQIGRELGMRYVLDGSVQRSSNQVRVNAHLVDAEIDTHLWADRFAGDISDLFALQDDITGRIANALSLALISMEAARPTENPDALDYIFQGRAAFNRQTTPANLAKAIGLFERALELDPHSAEAKSWLARTLVGRASNQMSGTDADDIARADQLIAQALAISPSNPNAHYAKGFLLAEQNRRVEAIPEFEAVVASDRNWAAAIAQLGRCRFFAGSIEELIPAQEKAIRLSPRDPLTFAWCFWIGQAHLLQSSTDEAIVWFEKAHSANAAHPSVHAWIASAYALKGKSERAVSEFAKARRLSGGRLSSIARFQGGWGEQAGVARKIRTLRENTFLAGLRKAGVPEE
jgi:tetratricopeptide (TPR) repeat protein